MTATVSREGSPVRARTSWVSVLTSAACVMGVAIAGWALAVPVLGVDLAVRSGGGTRPLSVGSVALVSLVAALMGLATRRLAERWTHGPTSWTVLACGVLVVSLLGPLSATTVAGWAVLTGLHLWVGLATILVGHRADHRVTA